ncbi:TlpA disulfide reductase family protein [Pedobacter sp. Leaf250]|uniref:TlpA family protein disulfide reductase n=1 Tax=Pedobacter sp. Leaf250 TaxID=2876559 RepID=UPI0011FDFDEB|nr:TlpA disulfide reductase family protein [Pedobacter sp. Leaf250]RZL50193.1 MAG: TlpA family protein disulfide reductase [Pedobacter sp.]
MLKKMLSIILISFSLHSIAQENTSKRNILNEQSVVRGEDGLVYPYSSWKKLISTGKYAIKGRNTSTDRGNPEYLLYELTADQRAAYFDKLPKPRPSDAFKEGDDFKGFKVTDMNGNKFDFRTAKDKVLVLNFWFIKCPPCVDEIPQLNELVAAYKDNPNVVFLAIALDEKYDIKNFLKINPYHYNIVDGGRYLANKFGVAAYPTHAVIDRNSKVKFGTVGLAPNTISWIEKSIDESLKAN